MLIGLHYSPLTDNVILHKLLWNRQISSDRQLGDMAGILAVQAEAIDRDYLQQWARDLGLEPELTELLSGKIKPKNT